MAKSAVTPRVKTPGILPRICALIIALFWLAAPSVGQVPSIREKQQRPIPRVPDRRWSPLTLPRGPQPPGPVHSVAEWEPSEGVMTLWWNWDLIDELQEDTQVYIPVDDLAEESSWRNYLTSHGVPLTNVDFLYIPTDTIYTRDYGPFFIWDGNDQLGIVNYTCGYGTEDDLFPSRFATLYGIDYHESGLNHVGGNWYPNAYGTAFSTTLVYTQNGSMLMDEVNDAMRDYYGIEHYHTSIVAPWTIEHHDCWGKPSDPETMLIAEFDEDSVYRPYGELVYDHYETLESPWGRPYELIRMPMFEMGSGWFEFRPYLNALVSNESVYVAVTGHPDDALALAKFQEAFPGYDIVGVDHQGTGFNDALHCRTRNFVKRDAIRIYPYPPGDTEDTGVDYPVRAEVIPPAGAAIAAGYPRVLWTETGGPPFQSVVMASTGSPQEYLGYLPARPLGTTVSFYIEARDDVGREEIYPMVAPDGMMELEVRSDALPPVLSRYQPVRSGCTGAPPPSLRVLGKDDVATPTVTVESWVNDVAQAPMSLSREELCYWYSGELGAGLAPGDLLRYRVVASDGAVAANTSMLPAVGETYCPIVGPGESVAIVDLSRRPCTGPFLTETLGDLGIPYAHYTAWPTDWSLHRVWFLCLGVYADNHILDAAQAADIVAALQSGDFVYLEGSDAWCYDPQGATLNPHFGVSPVDDGLDLEGGLLGQPATIAEGLGFVYSGANAYMDELAAVAPAQVLLRSGADGAGRTVLNDTGPYRSIASSFSLGALVDDTWPDTRKELLLRYLEFFEIQRASLQSVGDARPGANVTVRLEAQPGDGYVMLSSAAEAYAMRPGYGTLRLDLAHSEVMERGRFPASGVVKLRLTIPDDPALSGTEIHLQAVVGPKIAPGQAVFTNRQIVRVR